MRVLLESDSLIQFLIATHLCTTVFKDDTVDLMMYDSMPDAKRIYDNIKKSGIYNNCYLVTSVLAVGRTKLQKKEKINKGLRWLEMLVNPKRGTERDFKLNNPCYDIFVFCANGIFLDGIYNVCKRANPDMICYRYEGSLTSYLHDHENKKGAKREKFEKAIKKLLGYYDVAECVEKYYFFEPELIQFPNSYHIEKMSKIQNMDQGVKHILNSIFEFDQGQAYIKERFVAFEDGNLFYMNNNEEVQWYEDAASILGDDFVVRLHPRARKNRYNNNYVKAQTSLAPWEIYLMNQKMDGKTLITCASGSVFTSLIYFGMDVNVMMLFKCSNEKIPLLNDEFYHYLEAVQNKIGKEKIMIPENKDGYINLLEFFTR